MGLSKDEAADLAAELFELVSSVVEAASDGKLAIPELLEIASKAISLAIHGAKDLADKD